MSQDVCGIHNLHGMPGVIGCILGIWSTFGLTQNDHCTDDDCPRSDKQPGMQTAALFVTLGTFSSTSHTNDFSLLIVNG
jgi:ammonia channel protein AmtB